MATTIKTAISIQKSLFDQAESLAQQLNISRSHLFGLAIETYIQNRQNKILFDEINQAYSDEPDTGEKVRFSRIRRQHRKLVENEW
jgi:metal-responsive CopG/Arc/MetJ family transcriptional regulator